MDRFTLTGSIPAFEPRYQASSHRTSTQTTPYYESPSSRLAPPTRLPVSSPPSRPERRPDTGLVDPGSAAVSVTCPLDLAATQNSEHPHQYSNHTLEESAEAVLANSPTERSLSFRQDIEYTIRRSGFFSRLDRFLERGTVVKKRSSGRVYAPVYEIYAYQGTQWNPLMPHPQVHPPVGASDPAEWTRQFACHSQTSYETAPSSIHSKLTCFTGDLRLDLSPSHADGVVEDETEARIIQAPWGTQAIVAGGNCFVNGPSVQPDVQALEIVVIRSTGVVRVVLRASARHQSVLHTKSHTPPSSNSLPASTITYSPTNIDDEHDNGSTISHDDILSVGSQDPDDSSFDHCEVHSDFEFVSSHPHRPESISTFPELEIQSQVSNDVTSLHFSSNSISGQPHESQWVLVAKVLVTSWGDEVEVWGGSCTIKEIPCSDSQTSSSALYAVHIVELGRDTPIMEIVPKAQD
ncbi:hypothetical protein JAAARDRAFT_195572 [Jaapia argillacea MUCL 33604]|uniref:Uncharacterized protein n=1 Tax=Jaapia argillacea MUCL 33604 TaxID=933084 RepID=A0A067PZH8_9AGAM|nr:hypothetical protein JAAARDRAFT_195572 [Jaapia argillacea MUCL 33604]